MIHNTVDKEILSQAICATFRNRKTAYVPEHELFMEDFASDPIRVSYWNSFLRRIKFEGKLPLNKVIDKIVGQLEPYWRALQGL